MLSLRRSFVAGIFLYLSACSSEESDLHDQSSGGTSAQGSGASPSTGAVDSVGGGESGGSSSTTGGADTGDESGVGGASASGGQVETGGVPSGGGSEAAGGASSSGGSGGSLAPPTGDCEALVTDPNINWRQSTLTTDQEIVECLYNTLGRPIGYGENAHGGYDPEGNSHLVVIQKGLSQSVEAQILSAIQSTEHNWIVFDKEDFAEESEVAMYRLHCGDAQVQGAIGGSEDECWDYQSWCSARGYDGQQCLDEFFNEALNDGDLPIRNPVIASNTTIDGRGSNSYFRFSGFAIGSDSSGQPVDTATDVILTHLDFRGAGHTEDHELDPDMIRSTGASHDIWIHKNSFDLTGDSAFDVKVGAFGITISFNRVVDVLRASLHGSSDSREINSQITTTLHHNAFITRDEHYMTLGNTGRRVPLIRRGTSHLWNNLFMNYRKDISSVRVGATLLWEDNPLVINAMHQEKDDLSEALAERAEQLTRDVDGGNYRGEGMYLWFSDAACTIDMATQTPLTDAAGSVPDLSSDYSPASQTAMDAFTMSAGQDLIDYITETAGKHGKLPFNSPLSPSVPEVIASAASGCQ